MVVVESPYASPVDLPEDERLRIFARNIRFARACLAHSLSLGEAPFASHLLYTQEGVLNDDIPAERENGIRAGLELAKRADLTAVYTNLGISRGMHHGMRAAEEAGREIVFRELESWR
jgi:hypothetical protein